nr:FHA domain-containing protein [Paeniglutamicibacter psychrophenolicus]
MGKNSHDDRPILFVLDPNGNRGRRVTFSGSSLQVGREAGSGLLLDSPDVSRRHAVLWQEGNQIFVDDLGSTAGTTVNGTRLYGPQVLCAGDIVTFASTRLEVGKAPGSPQRQELGPSPRHDAATAARTRFDVGDQRADSINNIGGNQYNLQILEERRSLLLDVAATKTRARWILLSGFLIALAGASFFAAGIIRFLMAVADAASTGEAPDIFIDPFGVEILGLPSGLAGWAVAGLGMVLMLVGGVLHLVAIARQKRVDRELPLPPHP